MSLVSLLQKQSKNNILLHQDALELAEKCSVDLLVVQQTALENEIWPEPYLRHRRELATEQQLRLLYSTVAIVGCGGLGGQIFEQIVRLGIGQIIVIDPDTFAAHNLNRQLLCTVEELGCLKVEAAVSRAASVNPAVRVIPVASKFSTDETTDQLKQAEVILDGLDSVSDRHALAEFCHKTSIPLVHGAVNGWYGQIGVQKDSLLLKKLYPHIPAIDKNRNPAVFACTVATVASLQVAEVVKLLLNLDSQLIDGWKSIDLRGCEIELINMY